MEDKTMVDLILGVKEGFPSGSTNTPGKWRFIHEEARKLPVVNREDEEAGWKGFVLANKKNANAAGGSVATHCLEKHDCHKRGWRLQTAIREEDGKVTLWIRKIRI